MSEQSSSLPSTYYRAEAERVARLAASAEPGRGRERFAQAAAEYRTLANRYEAPPSALAEMDAADFPTLPALRAGAISHAP